MKHIIFTGGGSAGHITPNLVLIKYIQNKFPDFKITYIGKFNQLEKLVVQKEVNIPYKSIFCGRIRRYISFKIIFDLIQIPMGIIQSLFFLLVLKPNIVFAKGGYVSFPVCIAAHFLKLPFIIHESDMSPGLANKIISRWADHICISNEETKKFFPNKKVTFTGNPIGNMETKNSSIKKQWNIHSEKPIILILGGSQGDDDINKIIWQNLEEMTKKSCLLHVWGNSRFSKKKSLKIIKNLSKNQQKNYIPLNFIYPHEIKFFYKSAEIIITRCGAITLEELRHFSKKIILMPLTTKCSRGEQIENARKYLAYNQQSILLEDENSQYKKLLCSLNIIENKKILNNHRCLEHKNSTGQIIQILIDHMENYSYR